jgi:transposase-like protein
MGPRTTATTAWLVPQAAILPQTLQVLLEGFWSLLRSWLRPHRGISQEKLPVYLGFFEFVHNVRKRGKALLPALIELLVT